MTLHTSWQSFFTAKALSQDCSPNDFLQFSQRLSDAPDTASLLDLLRHSDFKCFAFLEPNTFQVQLCHHYSLVRTDSWRNTESYHVALQGMSSSDHALLFDPLNLARTAELLLPSPPSFTTLLSPEQLLALPDTTPHTEKKLMPKLVQVPPFLFSLIHQNTPMDPTDLFFLVRHGIDTYIDSRIAALEIESQTPQSHDQLRSIIQLHSLYFLQFLYAATYDPNNIALQFDATAPDTLPSINHWRQFLHQAQIGLDPPTTSNPPPPPPPATFPPPITPTNTMSPPINQTFAEATTALAFAVNTFATAADKLTDAKSNASHNLHDPGRSNPSSYKTKYFVSWRVMTPISSPHPPTPFAPFYHLVLTLLRPNSISLITYSPHFIARIFALILLLRCVSPNSSLSIPLLKALPASVYSRYLISPTR